MTTPQPAALPEHTIGKHDHPEPHTMCWWTDLELAAIKRYAESYALAALQAQPAAAGVSDEEILTEAARHLGEMHVENCGLDDIKAFARAILALRPQAESDEAQIADYQEALASVDALVRRLDVAINGNEAAPQARLCDIVSQVEREGLRPQAESERVDAIMAHVHDLYAELGIKWGDNPFLALSRLRPQAVPMTDGVFDLICKAIDKADSITMEGNYMLDSDDCIAVVRVMQALLSIHHGITAQGAEGGM